jgi:hypothetical protein
MTGFNLDYNKHCRLEFGAYVQTHEEHDNSLQSRTTGAIALRPTGNRQGGYYFLSLTTGRKLTRNRWTALPMPQDVIDRVNTLGRRSNAASALSFAWRDGTPISDLDDDVDDADNSSYLPSDGDDDDDDDVDTDFAASSDDDFSNDASQDGDAAAGVDNKEPHNNNEPANNGEDTYDEPDNKDEAPNNDEVAEDPAHEENEEQLQQKHRSGAQRR